MFKKAFDTTPIVYALALLFLATVATAVALQKIWLLLVPVALSGCLVLLQKPQLLFYVLILSIPWSVEYNFAGNLGTDLPDEPFMLLAAFTAIVLLLYQRVTATALVHPLLWILAIQFVWMVITVATSTQALISFKFILAKCWYLLSFAVLPVLILRTQKSWQSVAAILLASMMIVTLIGLVRHGVNGFTFAAVNKSLAPFFRNHVNYSTLLVCMVPLLAGFMAVAKGGKKWFLILLMIICLAALYFSYARGAWLALVVGGFAYLLLRKKLLWPAFMLAMLLAVGAVFWLQQNNRYLAYAHDYNTTIFHTDFKDHLVATYKLKDVSTAERFYRWVAGVRMIQDAGPTGFGPNTFYYNYKPYAVTPFKTWVSNNPEKSTVHNYFLLTIIEQGIVGFLLLIFLILFAFYKAQLIYHRTTDPFWKRGVACASVILAMICTVNFLSDLIETDKVGSLFYLCLSFLIVADRQTSSSQKGL